MAEQIEMPFESWLFGWRNHVLDGVKVGRIHLPPWGVTRQWCGLSIKFFYHLFLSFEYNACVSLWIFYTVYVFNGFVVL